MIIHCGKNILNINRFFSKGGRSVFEQIINVDRMEQAVSLFGSFDENIKLIEKEFGVSVINRGSELKITGEAENVDKASRAVKGLLMLINKGESLSDQKCPLCYLACKGRLRGKAFRDDGRLRLRYLKG